MTTHEWKSFLKLYSRELLSYDWSDTLRMFASHGAAISEEARRTQWLGYLPASEAAIEAAEQRLGRRLPPSLRAFYEVTNGWGMTGSFIFQVLPVERLAWLRDFDPHLFRIACENAPEPEAVHGEWSQYSVEQGTMVKRSLAVSDKGDAAIWLLDPGEPGSTGEWRGGCWASWNPGMEWTADSFAELMRNEFKSMRELQEEDDTQQ